MSHTLSAIEVQVNLPALILNAVTSQSNRDIETGQMLPITTKLTRIAPPLIPHKFTSACECRNAKPGSHPRYSGTLGYLGHVSGILSNPSGKL
jgi:hypothetical protein